MTGAELRRLEKALFKQQSGIERVRITRAALAEQTKGLMKDLDGAGTMAESRTSGLQTGVSQGTAETQEADRLTVDPDIQAAASASGQLTGEAERKPDAGLGRDSLDKGNATDETKRLDHFRSVQQHLVGTAMH